MNANFLLEKHSFFSHHEKLSLHWRFFVFVWYFLPHKSILNNSVWDKRSCAVVNVHEHGAKTKLCWHPAILCCSFHFIYLVCFLVANVSLNLVSSQSANNIKLLTYSLSFFCVVPTVCLYQARREKMMTKVS